MTQAIAVITTNSGVTVSDLEVQDGTPRIEDLRLAHALGFEKPYQIRPLIKRHAEALRAFGEVFSMQRKPGAKGGRPGTAYYLNEEQAIFITAKSDTPCAAEITVQMVRVFREYLAAKAVKVRAHHRALPARPEPTGQALTERDLYGLLMNAQMRVERGEAGNTADALYSVLEDRINRDAGMRTSGKILLSLPKDRLPAH